MSSRTVLREVRNLSVFCRRASSVIMLFRCSSAINPAAAAVESCRPRLSIISRLHHNHHPHELVIISQAEVSITRHAQWQTGRQECLLSSGRTSACRSMTFLFDVDNGQPGRSTCSRRVGGRQSSTPVDNGRTRLARNSLTGNTRQRKEKQQQQQQHDDV